MTVAAPEPQTDEQVTQRTPEEHRAHYGRDETGETLITFRGSIEIECGARYQGEGIRHEVHARTIRFRIVRHVDSQFDRVDAWVDSPDRPRDAFDVPGRDGGSAVTMLETLLDYIGEQANRIEADCKRH